MNAPGIAATATGVAIGGGLIRNKKWSVKETNALLAGGVLVVLLSFTAGTRAEPVAKGIAWLMLIAAILVAVPTEKGKKS